MSNDNIERLRDDIEQYTDGCITDYASHVDDSDIADVLRSIAESYDPESDDVVSTSNVEYEKTKSYELGHIAQIEDLSSELRERAGDMWASASSRTENRKAKQLKDLANELSVRSEEKRDQYDEKYD